MKEQNQIDRVGNDYKDLTNSHEREKKKKSWDKDECGKQRGDFGPHRAPNPIQVGGLFVLRDAKNLGLAKIVCFHNQVYGCFRL